MLEALRLFRDNLRIRLAERRRRAAERDDPTVGASLVVQLARVVAAPANPDRHDLEECDECGRPQERICVECGEYSHDIIKASKGWRVIPIPHPDCLAGLGWRAGRDACPRCEGISEGEEVARWRDHRYGAGNW
jgi:hypothetical protein